MTTIYVNKILNMSDFSRIIRIMYFSKFKSYNFIVCILKMYKEFPRSVDTSKVRDDYGGQFSIQEGVLFLFHFSYI